VSYLSEVLADAPLGYWRMAESGGARLANIGSAGLGGYFQSLLAPLALPYTGPNANGGSCNMNPALAYFTDPVATVWTFEALVYWGRPQANNAKSFAEFADNPANAAWRFQIDCPTSHFRVLRNGAALITNAVARPPDHWYHVVTVQDGVNVTLYMNAVADGAAASPTPGNLVAPVTLMSDTVSGANPSMWMSEAALYDVALTPARITAHFLAIDNFASPVWRGVTTTDTSGILAQIRDAVYKTFSNT